jgi:endonuclease I
VSSARTLLFGSVDVRNGRVDSLYNGETIEAPGYSILAYMRGFNTEHSWPQAQFNRLDPMVSDLHHIFAVDITSNGLRSSYGFGYNGDPMSPGSSLGASTTDGRSLVFQVRPERRGDVARAHFYMVARYAFDTSIGIVFDDDGTESNNRMEDSEEAVLRQWSREDPVDEWERQRNERVAALQGNRNPFIDRPDLIDRVADF